MSVVVAFMKPGGLGSVSAVGVGQCRARETISVPATTAISAQAGDIAFIVSTESVTVLAAHGTAPDAQATDATPATTAGYALPPNVPIAIAVRVGDKINVKALV